MKIGHGRYIDGRTGNDLFDIWRHMMARCRNPKWRNYKLYGGRGIDVCERWMDFWNFVADMGPRPTGQTIERKDNNGNYEPGNCRWATPAEQGNNRRTNVLITVNGETKTMSQWSRETGIGLTTIRARLARGWAPDDVVNRRPLQKSQAWRVQP